MKPNADLGARINQARRRAGLTVGELARQLDVSRGVMSDIVSGKRSPTPGIIRRLIELLDFDNETMQALDQISESTYTSSALDATMRLDKFRKREEG